MRFFLARFSLWIQTFLCRVFVQFKMTFQTRTSHRIQNVFRVDSDHISLCVPCCLQVVSHDNCCSDDCRRGRASGEGPVNSIYFNFSRNPTLISLRGCVDNREADRHAAVSRLSRFDQRVPNGPRVLQERRRVSADVWWSEVSTRHQSHRSGNESGVVA